MSLIVLSTPGGGGTELASTIGVDCWTTCAAIESFAGVSFDDLVIENPNALAELEDRALNELDPTSYTICVLSGSELMRPYNRAIVKAWEIPVVELWADLATQTKRLGFNKPHSVALGPVRAMLKDMTSQRRDAWKKLVTESICTSGWPMAQFHELADKILKENLV